MWRTYQIQNPALRIAIDCYAPDLDSAFAQARVRWPSAATLTCLGSTAD